MKKYPFIILLIVILAAVASIYAIPNSQEIALINFKDKKFDEARAQYEVQLKAGNLTPDIAGNLVDLYLQNGRVDDAVKVMEDFKAKRPDDLSARVILGQLYQYAQRQDDYLRNLEEIKAMHPSEQVLAKLHEEYQKDAQFEKQLTALQDLVKQGGGSDSSRYRSLAQLQAQTQKYDEAVASLHKVREIDPAGFKFPEVELLVSILCDAKKPEDALTEAKGWVSNPDAKPQQLARLANILHYKGTPQVAMSFLTGVQNQFSTSPELTSEYIMALIGVGQGEQAYKMMKDMMASNQLPAGLQREMLFQAVAVGDVETVNVLYAQVDIQQFNESQLITLTELSILRNQPELLAHLKEHFGTEDSLRNYPLFSVVLGLADKAPDADARIARAKALPLNLQQKLVIARACARAGKTPCLQEIIAKLGDVNSLNETEKADVAELYLLSKDFAGGKVFVEAVRKDANPRLDLAWVKFSAALGSDKDILPWIEAQNALNETDFKSLYFLASENGHKSTALMIAERLYAQYPTAEMRNFLVTAYIANKQYAKALPMLKEAANRTPQDEENYFYVLVNLSKQDPKYKKDLTEYAEAHLKNAKTERQRLAMVYTLVEAGRSDVALPFIKEYAAKLGGNWVNVYADALDKKGTKNEARDFRMEIATKPYTAVPVKRQIAFTLLNQGFKDDATALFYEIASRPDATKADAQQLLYLWGPRLSAEQVAWVSERALSSEGPMYDFWVERLTTQAGAEEILKFVKANPDSLNDGRIAKRYVQSLAALGYLNNVQSAEAQQILKSKNPQMLREFAAAARGNDKPRTARAAYENIAQLQPNDADALKGAGLIAFGQGDYKASDAYLNGYLQAKPANAPDSEAYLAYFYKAEMLRKQGKLEEAKSYYQNCLDTVVSTPNRSKDMQSKALQSMIMTGNVENGVANFRELLKQYPNDASLRADFASSLIEVKRYDEARQLLTVPVDSLNPSAGIAALSIPKAELVGYRFFSGGQELLLKLRSAEWRHALANPALTQRFSWLSYVTEGDDRVLLVAKSGTELALAPTAQGFDIFPAMQQQMSENDAARQMRLRYELLQARIDVETGKGGTAITRLNTLQPYYPNDAQLLGFTANAENYSGRWKRALALLDEAQQAAPENQDIAKLRRDIWLAHAPNVKLDHEWLRIGKSDQQLTTLSGRADINKNTDITAFVQNDYITADNIRRGDGRTGDFSANKQRAEITVRHDLADGKQTVHGSLYANNDTAGVGVGYAFLTGIGDTDVFAEYHRPTFDFYEGVFDDAVRDRVGISHVYKPTTRWLLSGLFAWNNYSIDSKDDVAQSISFNGQVLYQLVEGNPNYALLYGLDLEHRLNGSRRVDPFGVDYTIFPLDSREVHTLAVSAGYDFNERTHGDLLAGYNVDRFSGNGPLVEGKLTHEMLDDRLEAQLRAGYGMRTSNSQGDVTRLGGYMMYRF